MRNISSSSTTILFAIFLSVSLSSCHNPPPEVAKPNIIIILADDMGFSDIGSFGSEISTPNLDAMASEGLKMTNFYNTSRCCPTRASLLTGLYPHQAGVGHMVNEREQPSYRGMLSENCVTIAEVLKEGGYQTYMAGKWHLNARPEHWPRQHGFDRYFGLLDGANSHFGNRPYRPNQKLTYALDDLEYEPQEGFYSTDTYTDYAIRFIEEGLDQNQPFFLYLAYTAPHWPLHALPEDIAKYKGKYMKGWDELRKERYDRLKEMKVIHSDDALSVKDEMVPDWNSLSEPEKLNWDEKMAVYAAMVDRMDQNIGRLKNKLKELGQENNTIIMFLSDNGGSYENIKGQGFTEEIKLANFKPASDPDSFTAYEYEGAHLSNTPFRKFKRWEHEGGIATPFIAYYPQMIKSGTVSHIPAHTIDLMATSIELAGVQYPTNYKGKTIQPLEGISLVPVMRGEGLNDHRALFFEHEGNKAVRKGEWKIVSSFSENEWFLYNMESDRSEQFDLKEKYPDKVKELAELFKTWGKRVNLIPFSELLEYDKERKQLKN